MKEIKLLSFFIYLFFTTNCFSIETTAKQAILIDFNSGDVLFKKTKMSKYLQRHLQK